MTNITETVEEGKPNIITSVQVETAVFADCHFLQEAVENSERVTDSTIEDLYADGAYQNPGQLERVCKGPQCHAAQDWQDARWL